MTSRCWFITSSYSRSFFRDWKFWSSTRFWACPMAAVTHGWVMTSFSSEPVRSMMRAMRSDQWDRALIETEFLLKFLVSVPGVTDAAKIRSRDELVQEAQRASREAFQAKLDHFKEIEAKVGAVNIGGQALSHVMLGVIDEKWKDHLYDLDQLKAAIHYRQWGQKDPLIEYKREGYQMFVGLMRDVHATFAQRWLKLQIEIGPPPQRGAPSGPGGRPPASPASGPGAGLVKGPSPRRPTPMVASKPAVDGLVSGDPAVASQPSPVGAGVAPNPYAGIGRKIG